jgi:hypothetical protein
VAARCASNRGCVGATGLRGSAGAQRRRDAVAITTLVAAASTLGRPELLGAARRGGEWLLQVQGAAPRGGWAQQYTPDGRPASGRVLEVPALTTWETRHAVEALLALAKATGDRRYCTSAFAAARWLDAVRVGPSCWARFQDLDTAQPVFVDANGQRVRSAIEARLGYSWMGEFGIPWLLAHLGLESSGVSAAGRPWTLRGGSEAAAAARRRARGDG